MTPQLISIYALVAMFVVATICRSTWACSPSSALSWSARLVAGQTTKRHHRRLSRRPVPDPGRHHLPVRARAEQRHDRLAGPAGRQAVRGRIAAIPWIMFGISAVLTSVGAVSPGAVAIIAPIALGFAAQYSITPLLMGLMVIHGAQAGGFSPISIYGGITNGSSRRPGFRSTR